MQLPPPSDSSRTNDGDTAASALLGAWQSTEAFGNTALDWSQAIKDQKAHLAVAFHGDGSYTFRMLSYDAHDTDVTDQFRHIVAAIGTYTTAGNQIFIKGDPSGISWTFQPEEDNTLRIRLEGAKRFGRCKGVDVIYFKQSAIESP